MLGCNAPFPQVRGDTTVAAEILEESILVAEQPIEMIVSFLGLPYNKSTLKVAAKSMACKSAISQLECNWNVETAGGTADHKHTCKLIPGTWNVPGTCITITAAVPFRVTYQASPFFWLHVN